jgi:polyphosphate glucokinase
MTAQLIGVDVGGSGIKAASVDVGTGVASGRIRLETPQPATPDAVVAGIAELVGKFPGNGPVGCTLPAVVQHGIVQTAAHIAPSWIGTNAVTVLSGAIDRPCVVLNDADAAGIAEARYGAARGHNGLVVMVTIGTGVGTALLNDGVLVPNSELGHVVVNRHVADEWVSDATRVAANLTWKRWTRRLDRYLTHLHDVLWPDLIVIGGGIVKHADRFLERIDPGCEARIAELGNLAGIVGAAALAATAVPAGTTDRE